MPIIINQSGFDNPLWSNETLGSNNDQWFNNGQWFKFKPNRDWWVIVACPGPAGLTLTCAINSRRVSEEEFEKAFPGRLNDYRKKLLSATFIR